MKNITDFLNHTFIRAKNVFLKSANVITRESNCLTKSFKRKAQIRSEIMDSISHLCAHDITLPVDNRGTEDKYLYCKAARHLWVSMPAPSSIFSISSYEAFFFASTLVTALPKP